MTAQIIDGKTIAQSLRTEVAAEVARTDGCRKAPANSCHRAGWGSGKLGRLCHLKGKACMELGMGSIQ